MFGMAPSFSLGLLNCPRTLLQVLMMNLRFDLPLSSLKTKMNFLLRQSQSINWSVALKNWR